MFFEQKYLLQRKQIGRYWFSDNVNSKKFFKFFEALIFETFKQISRSTMATTEDLNNLLEIIIYCSCYLGAFCFIKSVTLAFLIRKINSPFDVTNNEFFIHQRLDKHKFSVTKSTLSPWILKAVGCQLFWNAFVIALLYFSSWNHNLFF